MKQTLLIIDPQIDFCDPAGALYVPNAEHDMRRLAQMIQRVHHRLDEIHVTLDSHHFVHIANPIFWQDNSGQHPAPFTQISVAQVEAGSWQATKPEWQEQAVNYVRQLAQNGRYQLTIWPPHCLIGSRGHAVAPELFAALQEWEANFKVVNYINKGSNLLTEHYSAIKADVVDEDDAATKLNQRLLTALEQSDVVGIAGEARTHCVANTVRDIADSFMDQSHIAKLVFLTDAASDIPGFENYAEKFLQEMRRRGMRFATTTDFLP